MPSFRLELNRCASAVLAIAALSAAMVLPQAQAAAVSGQGTWETTLQGRDLDGNAATFEAYYDTSTNTTWLADANFAKTSGYDADGLMNWEAAKTWADNLVVGNYSDWSLPFVMDTLNPGCDATYYVGGLAHDCGYNLDTGTQLGHLFKVTLGNKAYYNVDATPQSGWGLSNTGPFSNLQPDLYWSGVGYSYYDAFAFYMFSGYQLGVNKRGEQGLAWAQRWGDVAAAVVPEPSTYVLMGLGLAALMVVRKRRHH